MSFVVALSTKRYYYTYTTAYRIDKVLEIPVPGQFMDHLDEVYEPEDVGPGGNDEGLPDLLTFTEVSKPPKYGTIAYTSLKKVIQRVYKAKAGPSFTQEYLEQMMAQCSTRKEFTTKYPSEYVYMKRMRMIHLLRVHFGGKKRWNRELVMKAATECMSFPEFRERFPGAYNWAKREKIISEIEVLYNFAPQELDIKSKDELIHKILESGEYDVSETGNVYFRSEYVKPRFKRGFVPYFVYNQDRFRISVPIPRLVYTKFKGPIPEDKQIAFRIVEKKSPRMSSLQNMYLVKKKEVA
jgi:hypothetical protein